MRLPCRVVVPGAPRSVVADRAFDLSPQGLLVKAVEPLDVGEKVYVAFRATNLDLWFDTDATVARVLRGRRPGDQGVCYGLTFHSLSALQRLILRGCYRRVPPPLPRRAQRIDYAATVKRIST